MYANIFLAIIKLGAIAEISTLEPKQSREFVHCLNQQLKLTQAKYPQFFLFLAMIGGGMLALVMTLFNFLTLL
jgi:hypothetical protein